MSDEFPKWMKISIVVASGLLAFVFLGAGFVKLVGFEFVREDFEHWLYPAWFRIVTGLIEVAAAVLIVVPRTRYFGAVILIWVMIGAIITHLKWNEAGEAIFPAILMALAMFIWWNVHPHTTSAAASQRSESRDESTTSA